MHSKLHYKWFGEQSALTGLRLKVKDDQKRSLYFLSTKLFLKTEKEQDSYTMVEHRGLKSICKKILMIKHQS